MKKAVVKKQTKTAEIIEIRRTTPKFVRTILLFISSFIVIVGLVLGLYWYGKRTPLMVVRPNVLRTTTQYYDPLDLLEAVKKQNSNIIFLDIRSAEEYKKEHIKYAVSVPFYAFENNMIKYTDVQTTLKQITIDKSKFIVIYGPSTSFQRQQEVLSQLKKNGYTAQLLAVGWNELRHFQNIWVPEGLWGKIDINSFIDGTSPVE